MEPSASRPGPPTYFGGDDPFMPWSWAEERLVAARHYWIVTTRTDGRAHARPFWGIWLDGAIWFSSGSQVVRHLRRSPEVTVHLGRGDEVVIVEGVAEEVTDLEALKGMVAPYEQKYEWKLSAEKLARGDPGPVFAIRPRVVLGWGDEMFDGATRWAFH